MSTYAWLKIRYGHLFKIIKIIVFYKIYSFVTFIRLLKKSLLFFLCILYLYFVNCVLSLRVHIFRSLKFSRDVRSTNFKLKIIVHGKQES